METQAINKQFAAKPASPNPYGLAEAFEAVAASPAMALLQRYESRLQLMFQRAVRTLKLLRTIDVKNEPSPIPEQPEPPQQPTDSGTLADASVSSPKSSRTVPRSAEPTPEVPTNPPAPPANHPLPPKEPGGAV